MLENRIGRRLEGVFEARVSAGYTATILCQGNVGSTLTDPESIYQKSPALLFDSPPGTLGDSPAFPNEACGVPETILAAAPEILMPAGQKPEDLWIVRETGMP